MPGYLAVLLIAASCVAVLFGIVISVASGRAVNMAEVPDWLLARSRDRRERLEEQGKDNKAEQGNATPVQQLDVDYGINSGRMVKIVHQCDPPHQDQVLDYWGPGTQWRCDCGKLFTLDLHRVWKLAV